MKRKEGTEVLTAAKAKHTQKCSKRENKGGIVQTETKEEERHEQFCHRAVRGCYF